MLFLPLDSANGDLLNFRAALTVKAALLRLQILFFPLQKRRSGLGDEPDPASAVLNFPMLSGIVECDVACPRDFKGAKFTEWQGYSPKTMSGSL